MSSITSNRLELLGRLETRLGYHFKDKTLLDRALTHKSHSRAHNERLEFLGDAVLGYVIAEALYLDQPELAEDAMTIIRADLVRRETLAELAGQLGLGEFLKLGSGERKSGGRGRASILADALEGVIGAVSLDGGVEAARALVLKLQEPALAHVRQRRLAVAVKDAKTRLQELLQAESMPLPAYEVIETSGSEHSRTFTVACRVETLNLETTGSGTTRRAAEKEAAELMIEQVASVG